MNAGRIRGEARVLLAIELLKFFARTPNSDEKCHRELPLVCTDPEMRRQAEAVFLVATGYQAHEAAGILGMPIEEVDELVAIYRHAADGD